MAGRKSTYTPEIAEEICLAISTSTKSLPAICNSDKRFPPPQTFYRWMLANPLLRDLYARAKDAQLEIMADEIAAIADEPQPGETITIRGEEREVRIADMVEHRKLRIDTRKWLLSHLAPKKYGDRVELDSGLRVVVLPPRDQPDGAPRELPQPEFAEDAIHSNS